MKINLQHTVKQREQETKNWVYDLIKGEGEFVFVAEVPGPEDKIAVRLVDGILYVRGTGGFSKEVQLKELMKCKYLILNIETVC